MKTKVKKDESGNFSKVIELELPAKTYQKLQRINAGRKAAEKKFEAEIAILGLPKDGKAWAEVFELKDGEKAQVIILNENGVALDAKVLTQVELPPRAAQTIWRKPSLF